MRFFLPLAYDRIDLEKGTGYGTIARCNVLVQKTWTITRRDPENFSSCVLVATAGYTKESPEEATPEISVSLADQIWAHVNGSGFEKHIVKPCAWGTRDEIRTAFYEIFTEVKKAGDQQPEIYISTNLGHMPRVWLCVRFLKNRCFRNWSRFRFHFVVAPHSFTKKEWCQETMKFFIYLYRFLFKKW